MNAAHLDALDDDCDQPLPTDLVAEAWRRHSLAQHRHLSALVSAPAAVLERLEAEAVDAERHLDRHLRARS